MEELKTTKQLTHERVVPNLININNFLQAEMLRQHIHRYNFAAESAQGKSALDIACGTGYGSVILAEAGAKSIIGVDISDEALLQAKETAKKNSPNIIQIIKVDCDSDDIPLGPFDLIVSFETIEHLKDPNIFLQRLVSRLSPDGLIYASVPVSLTTDIDKFHLHDFTANSWRKLIYKSGLEIIDELYLYSDFSPLDLWQDLKTTNVTPPTNHPLWKFYLKHPIKFFQRVSGFILHGGIRIDALTVVCRKSRYSKISSESSEPSLLPQTKNANQQLTVLSKKVIPIILLLELTIQFASVFPMIFLLYSVVEKINPILTAFVFIVGFNILKLINILLIGLIIGFLPKPAIGLIKNPKDKFRYALLSALVKSIQRSSAGKDYFLMPFPGNLFFKLCGAKIHPGCVLTSTNSIFDPYLIEIGEGSILGDNAMVCAHYCPDIHTTVLGPVKVGRNVLIGRNSSVWANSIIADNAVIQDNSSVLPGSNIGPGEIWGGTPAQKLWGPRKTNIYKTSVKDINDIVRHIKNYICKQHNAESMNIDFDTPLLLSGLIDSLSLFNLLSEIENIYGIVLFSNNLSLYDLTITNILSYSNLSAQTLNT